MPLDFTLYYALLLCTATIAFMRWKMLGAADRVLVAVLCIALLNEALMFALMKSGKPLNFLSHIYSPLEFFLISVYFNYSLVTLKGWIGIVVGVIGIIVSVLNTLFVQPLSTFNSYFLLFESTAIVLFCLVAFHEILLLEAILPYRFALFWITVGFILFWGATFMGWGVIAAVQNFTAPIIEMSGAVLKTVNYALYVGLALVFSLYKKLIPSGYHAR